MTGPTASSERLLTPPDGRVREGDRPAPIEAPPASGGVAPSKAGRAVRVALILLIVLVGALALLVGTPTGRNLVRLELPRAAPLIASSTQVAAGGSIAAALRDAQPGTEIVVEPGEYREALVLPEGVRLVSRAPAPGGPASLRKRVGQRGGRDRQSDCRSGARRLQNRGRRGDTRSGRGSTSITRRSGSSMSRSRAPRTPPSNLTPDPAACSSAAI